MPILNIGGVQFTHTDLPFLQFRQYQRQTIRNMIFLSHFIHLTSIHFFQPNGIAFFFFRSSSNESDQDRPDGRKTLNREFFYLVH